MAEKFYTLLTKIGKAKIANSAGFGSKVNFVKMKVGDGGGAYYNPTEEQEDLVNTVWEGNITHVTIDENNPNWINVEMMIPANVGGFMIREYGVFDENNNMLAIAKCAESYKPLVEDGSTKELLMKMVLTVSNTENITLKIDPTIIFAKKSELEILENKIKNIKVPVTSVNSKIGAIELKAEDIKTNSGESVETQLADIAKDIKNIDLSADKVTVNNSNLNSKDVNSALTELFTFADNYKKAVSNVIGSPVTSKDTAEETKEKIQNIKSKLARNIGNKGVMSSETNTLDNLATKVGLIESIQSKDDVTKKVHFIFPIIDNTVYMNDKYKVIAVDYEKDGSINYVYVRDVSAFNRIEKLSKDLKKIGDFYSPTPSFYGSYGQVAGGYYYDIYDSKLQQRTLPDISGEYNWKLAFNTNDYFVNDDGEIFICGHSKRPDERFVRKYDINGSKIWNHTYAATDGYAGKLIYDEYLKYIYVTGNKKLLCLSSSGSLQWGSDSLSNNTCSWSDKEYLYVLKDEEIFVIEKTNGKLVKQLSFAEYSFDRFAFINKELNLVYVSGKKQGSSTLMTYAINYKTGKIYSMVRSYDASDAYSNYDERYFPKDVTLKSNLYTVYKSTYGNDYGEYRGVMKLSYQPNQEFPVIIK